MSDFAERYVETFARLGRPLGPGDCVPDDVVDAALARIGCAAGEALLAFHRAAGQARDVVDAYDHLLPPDQWTVADGRLIFYEEHQAVVLYALDVREAGADPPVWMTSRVEPYEWFVVCGACSTFLRVMTLWQCAFGGALAVTATAVVEPAVRVGLGARLEAIGEVNEMSAFLGTGLAVCLVRWHDDWRIFAGARDEAALSPLRDVGLALPIVKPIRP